MFDELRSELSTKFKNWSSLWTLIYDFIALNVGLFDYGKLKENIGMSGEKLEYFLFRKHNLCFYKTPQLSTKVHLLEYVVIDLDENLEPSKVKLLSMSGKMIYQSVNFKDVVVIRDNALNLPPFLMIEERLQKLDRLESCINKILTLKTLPLGAVGNKKQVKEFKEIAREFLDEKQIIAIADNTITDNLKTFDIKLNTTLDELYSLKENYIKETYASLGISYTKDKKERLITDEVKSDNDVSNMKYQSRHNQRKKAIEDCNSIFGTDIEFIPLYDLYEEDNEEDVDMIFTDDDEDTQENE